MIKGCNIGITNHDGTVTSVHCALRGGLKNTGAMLFKFYNTPERAKALIGLGNLNSVNEHLSPVGQFMQNYTEARHRDMNERYWICEYPNIYNYCRNSFAIGLKYVYIFEITESIINTGILPEDEGE
jgi:hypothetical protein